jgi:ASC-1-like (ASCH) protein
LILLPKESAIRDTGNIGGSLSALLSGDAAWEPYLESFSNRKSSLHLAVFRRPYLENILSGKKSIESRFSKNRCAPYGKVSQGDIVLLKRAGGPTQGVCIVSDVWNYRLNKKAWDEIRRDFLQEMFITDPGFLHERRKAVYATLMRLQHVRRIESLVYHKRDRRGWVVLRHRQEQTSLNEALQPQDERLG